MRLPDRETVESLYKRGMAEGGSRKSLARLEWDVAGRCLAPITRFVDARPAAKGKGKYVMVGEKTPIPLQIDLVVPCRKCGHCLKRRKWLWTARAIDEYRLAVRTWFGTFTLTLDEHEYIRHLCVQQSSRQGEDFDLLTDDEKFIRRDRKCRRWLTLWLKRVRKNSGAKLRYLIVCEAHKSGLPHYHALIHETSESTPVTKRCLQAAWPHGFTSFKLLPENESWRAAYACKYLSKSILARVRASIGYGKHSINTVLPGRT